MVDSPHRCQQNKTWKHTNTWFQTTWHFLSFPLTTQAVSFTLKAPFTLTTLGLPPPGRSDSFSKHTDIPLSPQSSFVCLPTNFNHSRRVHDEGGTVYTAHCGSLSLSNWLFMWLPTIPLKVKCASREHTRRHRNKLSHQNATTCTQNTNVILVKGCGCDDGGL